MFLHALCHQKGGVLRCHIDVKKIEDPSELEAIFEHFDKEADDCFRIIPLSDVDLEFLPNMLALQSITRNESSISKIIEQLFCDLLTSGMHLQNAPTIPRQ